MDISRWVAHRAEWSPDRVAVHCDGLDITYAAMERRVGRLAAALRGQGVGPGDRVAHLGHNSPELLELLFACARLGAMLVPLNWRLAPPELAAILADCAPRLLLVEPAFAGAAAAGPRQIVYGAAHDRMLAAAAPLAPERDDLDDATALLVYTSGTTGRSKGAMLSHAALFWNAVNAALTQDMTGRDHVLTAIPMFHVGGLNIQTTPAIHLGATVTIARRFDPGAALRLIAASRPTLFIAVPAMIKALFEHPDWPAADLSSLRFVQTGSSTVPLPLLRGWFARGVPIVQVYGMTESGPVAVSLRLEDAWRKLGSCGKPAPHCAARIVDERGADVPPGASGEILLRGPNLASGYWRAPAETAAAFADGWFRTGDIGHRDGEGFLFIDDRKKDVVISGGENIYPAELENVLAECSALAESAVVARPDPRWGEVPVACVVRRAGATIDAAGVLALFAGRLARYKHPRAVAFLDALPRNSMGKVVKAELRRLAAASAPLTEGRSS